MHEHNLFYLADINFFHGICFSICNIRFIKISSSQCCLSYSKTCSMYSNIRSPIQSSLHGAHFCVWNHKFQFKYLSNPQSLYLLQLSNINNFHILKNSRCLTWLLIWCEKFGSPDLSIFSLKEIHGPYDTRSAVGKNLLKTLRQ